MNENDAWQIKEDQAMALNEEQAMKMKEKQARKTKEDTKRKRGAALASSGLYLTVEKYMHLYVLKNHWLVLTTTNAIWLYDC